MFRRVFLLSVFIASATAFAAEQYAGTPPPKPDVPYLVVADNVTATEVSEASQQTGKKDDIIYVIAGSNSSAKTPLPSPVFVLQSETLNPDKLQVYKLDIRDGHREIVFSRKKPPKPYTLTVTRYSDNLFKLEVDGSLPPGEYSMTPEGSNAVFCFAVY